MVVGVYLGACYPLYEFFAVLIALESVADPGISYSGGT